KAMAFSQKGIEVIQKIKDSFSSEVGQKFDSEHKMILESLESKVADLTDKINNTTEDTLENIRGTLNPAPSIARINKTREKVADSLKSRYNDFLKELEG